MKKIAMLGLLLVLILAVSACPKKPGTPGEIPAEAALEETRRYLEGADETIETIENKLPKIYETADTLCSIERPPGWCKDLPTYKKDLEDGLQVANAAIDQALGLLILGKGVDARQITAQVIEAMTDIALIYAKIVLIISRHQVQS